MIPTGLKLTDLSTKWGLVTVYNEDGSLNRQYAISAANADDVVTGNHVAPDGCTSAEWRSGLVQVSTRPCDVGNCLELPNGHLIVNYGVDQSSAHIAVSLMDFPADEWSTSESGVVSVADAYAAIVDVAYQRVYTGA